MKLRILSILLFPIFLFLLGACATTNDTRQEDALRDFIEVAKLQPKDKIRTSNQDHWEIINKYFVIYKARRQEYLIEFRSACYDMLESVIVPDQRWESRTIRSRYDTLNGCRIDRIYELAEGQAAELTELGHATR